MLEPRTTWWRAGCLTLVGACLALALLAPNLPLRAQQPSYRVLLFSRTAAYRHDSIPAAITAITQLGAQHGFGVDATEDPARFTDAQLAPYAAVVFLMTTGDVLNAEQQGAFERYIAAGGGYAGIHSASDTEYEWPWYGGLVGAYFGGHPPGTQPATIDVEDPSHPSTAGLPARWQRTDEWYNFRTNPRAQVQVLARLDEATYRGGTMGDHPIAWYHAYGGGRAWYTAGGHTSASYREPLFLVHLLGGIRYAAGEAPAAPPTATSAATATALLNATPSAPPAATATATPSATRTATVAPAPDSTPRAWLPLIARSGD